MSSGLFHIYTGSGSRLHRFCVLHRVWARNRLVNEAASEEAKRGCTEIGANRSHKVRVPQGHWSFHRQMAVFSKQVPGM